MTEYDFSPEAYERYIQGQRKIAQWVRHTSQTPKADPYQAATPASDVPKELLPHSRLRDTNPPWSVQSDEKKRPRKHRTPSEKEFDRERRNDWKYSHREHMDALRATATRTRAPQVRKSSSDGTARPPPLENRSLHPGSRYPADHRFSDSQDTSSSSEYVYVPPITTRKRSSSVQAPIRLPLPGPLPGSMPLGPLPGPMPLPGPKPYYVYGAEINGQVELDDESSGKRRNKPTRSQTVPLPPLPASAPVYPSQQYWSRNKHSSSSSFLHQQQRAQQLRTATAYPFPYASSPLSPPNSAPAYPYPHTSAGLRPEPSRSPDRKSEPFLKRMFLNFASQKKTDSTSGETKGKATSRKERSGSLSQVASPSPSPTSSMTSKTWLGSPVKKKLSKHHHRGRSEAPRSKLSLDHWSGSATGGAGIGGIELGLLRNSLDGGRDREKAKRTEKERERDRTREKEKNRDERGRDEVRAEREYGEGERREERKDKDKDRDRDKSRWPDRSRSLSWERHKDRGDKDREGEDRYRSRHRHREREPDREREREKHRGRERERTPRR